MRNVLMGDPGRARGGGADRGGAVLPQLHGDARHGSGLPPRRRAARRLRSCRPQLPTQATNRAFADRLLDRLRALPCVEAAAIASSVPLDIHGLPSRVFTVEGRARTEAGFDRGAHQHRHARLFHGHGHSARARGRTSRDLKDARHSAAGDRQRGVRAALS